MSGVVTGGQGVSEIWGLSRRLILLAKASIKLLFLNKKNATLAEGVEATSL
jgi:hypothetical protein